MFRSFTSSENKPAAKGKKPQREGSAPPAAIQRAVKTMLAGAAGSIVWGVFWVIVAATSKSNLVNYNNSLPHGKQLTASQVNSQFTGTIIVLVVETLLFTALWVWMARVNKDGRGWARWVSSVLFLLWTYETYRTIGVSGNWVVIVDLVLSLLIWAIGVAAVYFIWRPESTAYYKATAEHL